MIGKTEIVLLFILPMLVVLGIAFADNTDDTNDDSVRSSIDPENPDDIGPVGVTDELIEAEKKILDILQHGSSTDNAVNGVFDNIYVHGVGITPIDGITLLYISIDPEIEDEQYHTILDNAKQVFGEMPFSIQRDMVLVLDQGTNQISQTKSTTVSIPDNGRTQNAKSTITGTVKLS